jgi:hypothetical protein
MKTNTSLVAVGLALTAIFTSAALAAEPSKPSDGSNADQILRQMSDKLRAARSFTVTAHRRIDADLLDATAVAEDALIEARVLRPNKLAAHAKTDLGVRHLYADGRTLTLLDERANAYAVVPMRTNIEGVVAALDENYGFMPPLAEFAVSNPYKALRSEAQSVAYVGREKLGAGFLGMGGVECHRLALRGKAADAELWIAVDDSLPRKLVATFHREGQPQVRVDFSSWNLAAPVSESDFAFTPPTGAERIELWTTARMSAASKKTAARKP